MYRYKIAKPFEQKFSNKLLGTVETGILLVGMAEGNMDGKSFACRMLIESFSFKASPNLAKALFGLFSELKKSLNLTNPLTFTLTIHPNSMPLPMPHLKGINHTYKTMKK